MAMTEEMNDWIMSSIDPVEDEDTHADEIADAENNHGQRTFIQPSEAELVAWPHKDPFLRIKEVV